MLTSQPAGWGMAGGVTCSPFLSAGTPLPLLSALKLKIGGSLATCQRKQTPLKFELGVKGGPFIH